MQEVRGIRGISCERSWDNHFLNVQMAGQLLKTGRLLLVQQLARGEHLVPNCTEKEKTSQSSKNA
jgi:hypothetical protein